MRAPRTLLLALAVMCAVSLPGVADEDARNIGDEVAPLAHVFALGARL